MNYQNMPAEVVLYLYTRFVAYKQGRIEKNDVLANAANTIEWLEKNGKEEEVGYYQEFMYFIAD